VIRIVLQGVSAVFGGIGVFFLWETFYVPHYALPALLCLSGATAIALAPLRLK